MKIIIYRYRMGSGPEGWAVDDDEDDVIVSPTFEVALAVAGNLLRGCSRWSYGRCPREWLTRCTSEPAA